MKEKSKTALRAVDFFCGGGGMSHGFRKAGVSVVAGIDNDSQCRETYEANHPDSEFICADIKELPLDSLEKRANVRRNEDAMIFIGCSPCQYWSIIQGRDHSERKQKSRASRNLLGDFLSFVDYYRPGFVAIENVRGIERHPDESGLSVLYNFFDEEGYKYKAEVLKLNDFGVPQTRRRFVLIASRMLPIDLPTPSKRRRKIVQDILGTAKGLRKICAGERDCKDSLHRSSSLSAKNLRRLEMTPSGGGREAWINDKELQIDAYRGKPVTFFAQNYGRMAWDKPAPTITTKFFSIGCGQFGHPAENRALSLREGALLQTFPKKYKFKTKEFTSTARIIGNAVPPKFAKILGKTIVAQVEKCQTFSAKKSAHG